MIRCAVAIGLALALFAPAHAGPGSVVRVEQHDVNDPPSRGPSLAPVTVEMFYSPAKSSTTRQAYLRVEKLQAAHPSRIRLLYRVIGRDRLPSAVLEAHAEGLFFELMAVLNDPTVALPSPIPDDRIIELGRRAGVDAARVADAIKREPFDDVIAANERRELQRVPGTSQSPTFQVLFNGQRKEVGDEAGLERAYGEAYAHATDLLERGVGPEALFDTLDAEAAAVREVVYQPGEPDWADTDNPEETLASPPLDLQGLPSYGPADAALTIAVLCDPGRNNCALARNAAQMVANNAPGRVRVVWQPFFDTSDQQHTAEVGLLGDAALCAEQLGTNSDDAGGKESSGWLWLKQVAVESSQRSRHVSGEAMMDRIAQRLGINGRKLAACRARIAGTTVNRIELARASGVHTSPATVVGGRVYPPIVDQQALQALVERELAPGVLDSAAPWTRPARPYAR